MSAVRTMPWTAAAASDAGRQRSTNEDRVLCDAERGIFAVIDGVGGESAGEIAAETALEVLRGRLSRRTTDPGRRIREAIALANRQIWERAQADPRLQGMACVMTVAVVENGRATVGHVGDSRLYQLRHGEIRKLTRDHSPVGAREESGELSEAEAMRHPRRNEIFRDVGSAPHGPDDADFIELLEVPFDPESALLLCSDGLSDLVPAAEIRAVVERHAGHPDAAARALIQAANAAGGKDNVSVVLVEGERFAAAGRAAGRPARRGKGSPEPRGRAGQALPGVVERWRRAVIGRATPWLWGLLGITFGLVLGVTLARRLEGLGGFFGGGDAAAVLRVGTAGDFRTIGEALAAARPGQTVEVAPGEYREQLRLRSGVALVSRTPRGAVLRPAGDGPAITAESVRGARLAGFRVLGGEPDAPLAVGVRLVGSEATVEEVEVVGAAEAAVEVLGEDRSTLRYSYLHDNPGAGVVVRGEAAPRLLHNLIAGNGGGPPRRPGVDVRDAARPLLAGNRIERNAGPQVRLAVAADAAEVWFWNSFGASPRAAAVVASIEPGPPSSPEPR
jgi:serine/threonine protein phosphatase PrpC